MKKETVTLAADRYRELLAKEMELADLKRLLRGVSAPAPETVPDVEI